MTPSSIILVAVIPSEWQSVSDTQSDKESNVTQMLYSSSPTRLTQKAKQTSPTATFNQSQPRWRPFLTLKGTSAVELFAEFVLMRDTFPSNEVNHITSASDLQKTLHKVCSEVQSWW